MKRIIITSVIMVFLVSAATGCGKSGLNSSGSNEGSERTSNKGLSSTAGDDATSAITNASTAGKSSSATQSAVASGKTTNSVDEVTVYAKHSVNLSDITITKYAKIKGRTAIDCSGMIFEWTASGFELYGELEGDVIADISFVQGDNSCFLRLQVDGKDTETLKLDKGDKKYSLAKSLKKGKHKISVLKMTEAFMNSITVYDITFTGKLYPLKAASRKIEFVGDSITAGLDMLVEGAPQGDIGEFEDGTRTYAALTANAFGADYHVFACAGWGFLGGAGGAGCKIPNIYGQSLFLRKTSEKWKFSSWEPDIVVVNLGTNDGGFMWQNKLTDLDFEKGMRDFVGQIRKENPQAEIIWAYGMLGNGMKSLMLNAIEDLQIKDKKVHFVELPNTTRPSGSHPGLEDNKKAARILTAEIKKITGWKEV